MPRKMGTKKMEKMQRKEDEKKQREVSCRGVDGRRRGEENTRQALTKGEDSRGRCAP